LPSSLLLKHFLHPDHTNAVLLFPAVSHRSSASWLQALSRCFSPFRSQAMHPPPSGHGPPPEGRDWRGRKMMEETMRALTLIELMRLTRTELTGLLQRITSELANLPKGSAERRTAAINLSNIRAALTRRDFSP
jgi:hypothetical protein